MKKNSLSKRKIYIILAAIILLQILYITYVYVYERCSYHSDEIWSFGLANSTDGPHVFADDHKEYVKNLQQWLDGKVFRDYLSVQENERFDYAAVWHNLGSDDHPPLYFALLHTICSFVPNTYNVWYGYAINIVVFIIGQSFLFFTAKNISGSDVMGFACVILWGICTGSINMVIFARHYEMSIMWAIILMYCYSRMMKEKQFRFRRDILPIAVVTFLGCMTNYLFVAFAFFFTGVFVIYFLVTKRYKTCLVFSVSVLAAVLLMCLVYPAVLVRPFQKTKELSRKANYDYQLLYCIYYTMAYVFGIFTRPYHTMTAVYILYGIAGFLIVVGIVAFLCRKEVFWKRFVTGTVVLVKKLVLVCYAKKKDFPVILLAMLVSAAGIVALVAGIVCVPEMGVYTDRYLSVAFPALVMGCFLIIFKLWELLFGKMSGRKAQIVLLCISVLGMIWNRTKTLSPYLFLCEDENFLKFQEIREITKDADCIVGMGGDWHLTVMSDVLYDVRRFYAFDEYSYLDAQKNLEEMQDIDTSTKLYVLLDETSTNLPDTYNGASINYINKEKYLYSSDKIVNMIMSLPYCKGLDCIGVTVVNDSKYYLYEMER